MEHSSPDSDPQAKRTEFAVATTGAAGIGMTGSASAGSASRIIGDTCISKLSHDEPPKIICRLYADRQFGSLQPEHKVFRHAHARPGPLIEELANFFVKSLHASKATRMSRNLCRGELPFLHELYTLMRDFFLARQVEQAQDVT